MTATRATVLQTLRKSGRPMISLEVADEIGAPSRIVGRILGVLFFKNLVERRERMPGLKPRFEYRAYEVNA